jgi:predicted deacylase
MIFRTVLILLVFYIIIYLWANNIDVHIIDSKIPGPTVLIVGSTHGNEPAGTVTIENIISKKNFNLKRGKLLLVPRPNKLGYLFNMRYMPHRIINCDLNRNYPKEVGELPKEPISSKICQLADKSDFIIDLHEGWGFHRIQSNSLGSGIYPGDTHNSISLSYHIAKQINTEINDPNKKFVVGLNSHPELTSLRSYCNMIYHDYILIETTGQKDIQPIQIRTNQMLTLIDCVLFRLKMI